MAATTVLVTGASGFVGLALAHIGLGAVLLGVPLAVPLAVIVFHGAFVPIVGVLLSGAVAVLVALVTVGPTKALILLVVIGALIVEHVKIRFGILLLAAALPAAIFWQFGKERWRIPPAPPEVTYISTFEEGRSDAQIEASNRVNQAVQERLRAEQRQREEEAKETYRALGRASGLDVEAMEREIAREKAAESKVAD